MHRRPHKLDREATRAAKFTSRYSYISRKVHEGTSKQCEYLAGSDCEARRREIFGRDGYRCQVCHKVVPWEGDLTVRGHLAHGGNTKVSRCWCPQNLKLKCYVCHMLKEHNREVKWSFALKPAPETQANQREQQ